MVGDVLRHLIAGGIILTIGLILGYRPEAGIVGVLASFAMLITVGFGMGWIFIVLGLLIRTPMTVMTIGFSFLFPLVFASNIMVDPETMPSWLRAFVEVNPVSMMTIGDARAHGRDGDPRADSACAHRAGGHHVVARAGDDLAVPQAVNGASQPFRNASR